MTQQLIDSLVGVELIFAEKIDIQNLARCFSCGEKYNLWMIEVESEPDFKRFRGVDMYTWDLVYLDLASDYAYLSIPTNNIPDMTEETLSQMYCDIGKRLGAMDILFNGKSILNIEDIK
ncbi:MAG: hypothetical protein M0R51_15340 [Clostridia bacterium]|jgi:hypothetical protein|nr:hypothetical protein [Clostridia bacterium]